MVCFVAIPHSYVIFMLSEGFEMECIHRCISQTSWWWSRSASLWAVSPPLLISLSFSSSVSTNCVCCDDCDPNLKTNVSFSSSSFYPKLSLWTWKLIFMPGCLWSSVKRKAGVYFTFYSALVANTRHIHNVGPQTWEKHLKNVNISAVASSAKSVQEMKWRSRPRPSSVLCPVGKGSSSR